MLKGADADRHRSFTVCQPAQWGTIGTPAFLTNAAHELKVAVTDGQRFDAEGVNPRKKSAVVCKQIGQHSRLIVLTANQALGAIHRGTHLARELITNGRRLRSNATRYQNRRCKN